MAVVRYTVVAGDTLSAIAKRFYGDASLYPLIAKANKIADPDVIFPNQVLVIPSRPYTVVKGDTLSALAKRFYGNANLFTMIADENGLSEPYIIHPGQVLKIPPRPQVTSEVGSS